MRINVLADDELLKIKLKESGLFEEVNSIQSLEKCPYGYLLLSDRYLPYQELATFTLRGFEKVFYMLTNSYEPNLEKNVKAICDSREIILIPPKLVREQIISLIDKTIHPSQDRSSNVFAFYSVLSNVGTTSTCLSVGMTLKEHTHAKVGVLLLNAWDDGTDQIDYKGTYLDEIKPKLTGQLFQNNNEFLSAFHMIERDALYILGGNRNTRMERLYTEEEISYLINKAKEVFDIVLIDCGSHFDNAIMVQSLMESDFRFLVINQQPKAIKKFNYVFNDILYPIGYKVSDFLMIINQYQDEIYLPSAKDIHKEMNIPVISHVPKNEYGISSEQEQKILYLYNDPVYQESINIIGKSIAAKMNIEFVQSESKKRKRFFGR